MFAVLKYEICWGLLWQSSGQDRVLPLPGALAQSLAWEIRFCMVVGATNK